MKNQAIPNKYTTMNRFARYLTASALAITLLSRVADAATVTWDANTGTTGAQDGAGTWDTTTANWWNGTADQAWPNTTSDVATIGVASGAAGTISVSGTITLNKIQFNAPGSGNYTLSGTGTLGFGGTTPTVAIAASQTPTINTVLGENAANTGIKFSGTSSGSGNITLGGANTYSGATSVEKLTLFFNSLANAGSPSSFGTGSGTGTITVSSASSATVLTYNGSGGSTDRLVAMASGTGNCTINNSGSGAINFNNNGSFVSSATAARTLTLGGAYTGANTFAELITDASGYAINVSKQLGGTWRLSNTGNTFSGTITAVGGDLQMDTIPNGANKIAFNGGTVTFVGASASTCNRLIQIGTVGGVILAKLKSSGSGPIDMTGTGDVTQAGGITAGSGLQLGGSSAGDNYFRSRLTDLNSIAIKLEKVDAGTWILTGANTYSGVTAINAGTLAITAANCLGTGTSITFGNSSTANLSLANAAAASVTIPATTTISTFTAVNCNFGNAAVATTDFYLAAKITGSGNVKAATQSSSLNGVVRFSNDGNDYTGDFLTGRGAIEFTSVANGGVNSALGKASTAYILGNSLSSLTMRYVGSGNSSTDRALDWQGSTGGLTLENAGVGTVQYLATGNLKSGSGSAGLTLRGSNLGDNTLAQVVNDSGGVTSVSKSDAGKWILTGANTYTGSTTVNAGTLLVNGSLGSGSAVTVKSTAILGGTGTIGGTVTVNSGGTIAPGASIGTLTLSSAPGLSGKIVCELDRGNAQTADKIVFGSATTFGGTLTVVNVGATPQVNDTFDLFDGSLSGAFATVNLPGGPAHWNTGDLNIGGSITFTGNNAPTADSFDLQVATGGSTTVSVIGKYATDADAADVLTITAVSSPSHGTVAIQGGNVVYTSTDSAASDSFTYTVSDGIVTATATASVIITPATGHGANIISVTPGTGTAMVTFAGIPGAHYAIERSLNLSTWTEVAADVLVPSGGIVNWEDTSAPSSAYYRTRYVSGL